MFLKQKPLAFKKVDIFRLCMQLMDNVFQWLKSLGTFFCHSSINKCSQPLLSLVKLSYLFQFFTGWNNFKFQFYLAQQYFYRPIRLLASTTLQEIVTTLSLSNQLLRHVGNLNMNTSNRFLVDNAAMWILQIYIYMYHLYQMSLTLI